jgi:hypothetical protein
LQHVTSPADKNDARASLHETLRDTQAKPAASAGDERSFAFKRKRLYHDAGHSFLKPAGFKQEKPGLENPPCET